MNGLDTRPMRTLELFAGIGGGLLGGDILGHRPVCSVEIEPYCQRVLRQRIADGVLPDHPIWDDVTTFDGRPWRGLVDLISGGFPCQDISSAGKGSGIDGEHSGLWSEFERVVREIRPRFVFVENAATLNVRGLGRVLRDLAALGYDAEWCVLGARHVGAPHDRDRTWILAHADNTGDRVRAIDVGRPRPAAAVNAGTSADPASQGANEHGSAAGLGHLARLYRWPPEPDVPRVDDGDPARMGWTCATGNAQVPAVHALAFRLLYQRLTGEAYRPNLFDHKPTTRGHVQV